MLEVFIAAGIIMISSLVGVLFTVGTARQFLEQNLSLLVSFSAGVFFITAGALALEVFAIIDSLFFAALLIGVGYATAWILHTVLPETHHHHDPSCGRSHGGARKLLIGDGIHNIADGVILVTAFLTSPVLGLAVTVSVLIHEVLQEISEFFVLRQAGYTVRRALLINFVVSGTILIGVGLGFLALASHALEGVLLALSAGFFFHVVVHDLLPRRSAHETVRQFGYHVLVLFMGALIMGTIATVLGDTHTHGHTQEEDHEHDEYDEHGVGDMH